MISESTKNHIYSTLAVGTGLGMFAVFSGCMTIEQMAPSVGPEFRTIAARHSVEVETLELGRKIYLSDCVKCHSVEPIGRHSVEKWRGMFPKMFDKTLLYGEDARALEAYVTLAHVFLAETARGEAEIAESRESTSAKNVEDTNSTH